MAFELFQLGRDGSYSSVEFKDLDNKSFWCHLGNQQEDAFVRVMEILYEQGRISWKVAIHPLKKNDPYHPDLLCSLGDAKNIIGEVKIKNSPLFLAMKNYGINPQTALTMDLKDSFNYEKLLRAGIDLRLFIWVKWEAHKMVTSPKHSYNIMPMKGIWTTTFSRLREYELTNPPPIHWYKEEFRQPKFLDNNDTHGRELAIFDSRLIQGDMIKGITSQGYTRDPKTGIIYPSGHSSCSYVFDLNNTNIFDRLIYSNRL